MTSWSRRTKAALRTFSWRWIRNFSRAWGHVRDRSDHTDSRVKWFVTDGLVSGAVDELLGSSQEFDGVRQAMQAQFDRTDVHAAMSRTGGHGVKEFVFSVLPKDFHVHDPYVQLAIHPRLLDVVNEYLGLQAYLRAIVGWINVPTPGPPTDTQLWHQDQDDLHQVKAFFYCSHVDRTTGPFCFIPQTHRRGQIDTTGWFAHASGRLTDAEMAAKIPEAQWFMGTGPPGTLVLADTTGCHKGLKPQSGPRLLVMFHYTSGAPRHPRSFRVLGELPSGLTTAQRAALLADTGVRADRGRRRM